MSALYHDGGGWTWRIHAVWEAFTKLSGRRTLFIPSTQRGFLNCTRSLLPKAHRNNDDHPTKAPDTQHQSTHQQSPAALTTSSPLKQIRPGPAGTQCSLFRKNTLAAIFFLTGCVFISFCSALVAVFHHSGDGSKSFDTVIAPGWASVVVESVKKKHYWGCTDQFIGCFELK